MNTRKTVSLKELAFTSITIDVRTTGKSLPAEYKDVRLVGNTPKVGALDLLTTVPNGKLWELNLDDGIKVMLFVGDKPSVFGQIMLGDVPTLDLGDKLVVRIDHADLLIDLLGSLQPDTTAVDITPYLDTRVGAGGTVFTKLHTFANRF